MDPAKRTTYIIAAASLVAIIIAIYFLFIFKKAPKKIEVQKSNEEVEELSKVDISKRPYVTLTPTSDGAEIIISFENMSYFDRIEYELTYLANNPQVSGEKIERGSTGTDVNTKDSKYKKSILLGTASKGVRSPDKGIGDGKLTLHLFKNNTEYQSESSWNLIQIGSKTTATDLRGNLHLEVSLGKSYWVIVADTVGVPMGGKLDLKNVILPVYGTFSVAPTFTNLAKLSIKLASDAKNPQLYAYNHQDAKWQKLDSTYDSQNKTVSSTISNFATFVVVSAK